MKRRTGYLKFYTPANDPMVVTAKCTQIMLEERMLEMAIRLDNTLESTSIIYVEGAQDDVGQRCSRVW